MCYFPQGLTIYQFLKYQTDLLLNSLSQVVYFSFVLKHYSSLNYFICSLSDPTVHKHKNMFTGTSQSVLAHFPLTENNVQDTSC